MPTIAATPEAPWRAGVRSARVNLVPGLALQALALALVLAYYWHAPTRAALAHLAAWRVQIGFPSAILSTAFFGGLLPFLYLRLRIATRSRYTWAQGAAIIAFWGYKGFEVDLFYRALAHQVGAGHDPVTIFSKTLIDQLAYSPLLAVPMTTLFFEYTELRFDRIVILADLRAGGWYRRRVVPILISNVGVWLPAVCIIYTLPTPLQLPLQNLVLCFYTLLIAQLTKRAV